jgi:hypothetical protein
MGPLDVPEVLICISLLGALAWAVYNWTHPHHPEKDRRF